MKKDNHDEALPIVFIDLHPMHLFRPPTGRNA